MAISHLGDSDVEDLVQALNGVNWIATGNGAFYNPKLGAFRPRLGSTLHIRLPKDFKIINRNILPPAPPAKDFLTVQEITERLCDPWEGCSSPTSPPSAVGVDVGHSGIDLTRDVAPTQQYTTGQGADLLAGLVPLSPTPPPRPKISLFERVDGLWQVEKDGRVLKVGPHKICAVIAGQQAALRRDPDKPFPLDLGAQE